MSAFMTDLRFVLARLPLSLTVSLMVCDRKRAARNLTNLAWNCDDDAVMRAVWNNVANDPDYDRDEVARECIERAWKSSPAVAGSRALDHLAYDTEHSVGYYSDDPMSA